MVQLAIGIVSFIIVVWAIIAGLVVLRALWPVIAIAFAIGAVWYAFAHIHDPGSGSPFILIIFSLLLVGAIKRSKSPYSLKKPPAAKPPATSKLPSSK